MTLHDWLADQPFTLTMSSGFFGFFAHAGMMLALDEAGLRPARLTGSSAGALVGAACASGLSARETVDALLAVKRMDFWDPGFGAGFLRGTRFRQHLATVLASETFEDCVTPFAVSMHAWATRSTRVIDSGDLAAAVCASCAVPVLFHPQRINGEWCADGGIKDRWGLAATKPGERIFYHHIGSRSPWRKRSDPALQIPVRDNLAALELFNMPRSGPLKLHLGPDIVRQAADATRIALRQPRGVETELFRTA